MGTGSDAGFEWDPSVGIYCQNNTPNSVRVDYIYRKMQKGKPSTKDLPLLENDITNIFDL